MSNIVKYFCILFVLLFIQSPVFALPEWSNNSANIPSNYNSTFLSEFNITWINNISTVFLEQNWTNSTGENITISNIIENIYTHSTILPAGTYYWKSYANDTNNNWTASDNWVFTIEAGSVPIHLYLNDSENNKTDDNSYDLYDIANFTVTFDWYNETIYLDSNYPGWILQNDTNSTIYNLTELNSTGLYHITAYWNSTNENYTDSVQTYYFGVKPYWINNNTSVASGSTYVSGETYQFNITWIGDISNISFETNLLVSEGFNYTTNTTINISNNTNSNYWITFTDLAAGNYYYKWHINDTKNNSVSTPQFDYDIDPISVGLSWFSPSYWTWDTGTSVPVECKADDTINLTLSIEDPASTIYSSTLGSVSTSVESDIEKTYRFTCRPTNTNYSGSINSPTLTFQLPTGDDTTPPPGPGGGDDFVPGTFTIEKLVSSVSINAGESKSISFDLKNTLNNDLLNITITLTGIHYRWYSIPKIDKVPHGMSKSVTIRFNIPEDAEVKDYSITIKATGKKPLGGTKTTRSKTLTLTVNPKVEEEEIIQEAVIISQENVTTNETEPGPTGFLPLGSEYFQYLVLLVGAVTSILIFVKRDLITYNLMKFSGRKAPKKLKRKKVKLPSLKDFSKLPRSLKKLKRRRKPEELKREIRRDISELQNLIEAEKRIKKRKK